MNQLKLSSVFVHHAHGLDSLESGRGKMWIMCVSLQDTMMDNCTKKPAHQCKVGSCYQITGKLM